MKDDQVAVCPACHAPLAASDPRFTAWCPACDWNVDPSGPPLGSGPAQARRWKPAPRQPGPLRPNTALWAALVLATAVNLSTVLLAVAGAWLLATGTWPEKVAGALGLLVAWMLRPAPGRMPRHTLDRSSAPTLYAVAHRVADALGLAGAVDVIAVDSRYGSGLLRVGLRQRQVLVLGLPLWEVLTADERIALLGHQLAYTARHGSRRRWIAAALDALDGWASLLGPDREGSAQARAQAPAPLAGRQFRRSSGWGVATLGEKVGLALLSMLSALPRHFHRELSRLNSLSAGQDAYSADRATARVASTPSAQGLIRALLLEDSAAFAIDRLSRSTGDLWLELRAYIESVPESEGARLLRRSQLRAETSVGGCPSLCSRLRGLEELPYAEPAVAMSSQEIIKINAELNTVRASVAEDLRA